MSKAQNSLLDEFLADTDPTGNTPSKLPGGNLLDEFLAETEPDESAAPPTPSLGMGDLKVAESQAPAFNPAGSIFRTANKPNEPQPAAYSGAFAPPPNFAGAKAPEMIGDLFDLPSRGAAALRGMPMNEDSYFFKPEFEAAQKLPPTKPYDGPFAPPPNFAGNTEFAARMVSDPLSAVDAAFQAGRRVVGMGGQLRKAAGEAGMEFGKGQAYKVLKPGIRDEKKGLDIEKIYEYNLDRPVAGKDGKTGAGGVDRWLNNSDAEINAASKEMKDRIQAGADEGIRVDIPAQINAAIAPILADKLGSKQNQKLAVFIKEMADKFKKEARDLTPDGTGRMDLMAAQYYKQNMGDLGAWHSTARKKGFTIPKTESEESQAAEILYHHLNDYIDEAAPDGIRDLNRKISDLLPIRQAAAHRKIIEDRNNRLGINDMMSFAAMLHNPLAGAGLYAVNKASKSGRAADVIYRLSERLKGAKTPAEKSRYIAALKKIGATDEEIRAGLEVVEASGGENAFQNLEVRTERPRAGSGQGNTVQFPAPAPMRPSPRAAMAQEGPKPPPRVPPMPKESREFNGRRGRQEIGLADEMVKTGDPDYPSISVPAKDAPPEFTLNGMKYKRAKGDFDNIITYKDEKGRPLTFRSGADMIHMDDPARPFKPSRAPEEAPPPKDDFLDEDGRPLFQEEDQLGPIQAKLDKTFRDLEGRRTWPERLKDMVRRDAENPVDPGSGGGATAEALTHYGETPHWQKAGFLTPDGKMLNFGNDGRDVADLRRTRGHEDVARFYRGTPSMQARDLFMEEGNIRLYPEAHSVQIRVPLKPEQRGPLEAWFKKAAEENKGRVRIEVNPVGMGARTDEVFSRTYPAKTSPQRIFEDIDAAFAGQKPRELSDMQRLRSEDGPTLYQEEDAFESAGEAGLPKGREDNPKVRAAAAKAWKEKGTESPFFKRWFGESKVVDEAGKPKVVYHGTTHKFNEFDDRSGNIENHYGRAFYFTDSKADVKANYAGVGPDLESRIELRAEQILNEIGHDNSMEKARKMARKELVGGKGKAMDLYLKMENPVIMDGPKKTRFQIEINEDDVESGNGLELYNALHRAASKHGAEGQAIWNDVMESLEPSDFTAKEFEDALRKSENVIYIEDPENGSLASNQFIRDVYEKAGFDGIVMDADAAFGSGRGVGKKMEMDAGAHHYIAFNPKQIKSATGNRGTFDAKDPNILHQRGEEAGQKVRKGQIQRKRSRWVMTLFEGKADVTTWLHEHSHWLRGEVLSPEQEKLALNWSGEGEWNAAAEEKFARGFERYLYNGVAPSKELRPAMETLKKSFREVYADAQGSKLAEDIPPEMKMLYDALLLRNQKIRNPKKVSRLIKAIQRGSASSRLMDQLRKELSPDKENP